jgi:ribosomal protein L11 methylase PrmA
MAVDVEIDIEVLKIEIKKDVRLRFGGAREGLHRSDGPRLEPGEHVLDLGCGAGTDSLVAAQMVGE